MSKPRQPWWGYARNMIRIYPERKKELEELHSQQVTAMNCGPGGCGNKRRTENIALRQLPKSKQQEYDAVNKAIETTLKLKNGCSRMEIISLVYWKKSHTLEGAGCKVGYAYKEAREIHRDFVRLVGAYYGFCID